MVMIDHGVMVEAEVLLWYCVVCRTQRAVHLRWISYIRGGFHMNEWTVTFQNRTSNNPSCNAHMKCRS
jgi:hypothetical protein